MKIALAIATTDRPNVVAETLRRLNRQTRAPDHVLVVGASESDFPAGPSPLLGVKFTVFSRGLTRQRNHALDLLQKDFDIITFIDDDFFPSRDFFAGVERLATEHPEVIAASGHILADGILTAGLSFAEADAAIAAYEKKGPGNPILSNDTGIHGANMMIKMAALPQARFDENLPLYRLARKSGFLGAFRQGRTRRSHQPLRRRTSRCEDRTDVGRKARLFADRQSDLSRCQRYDA